VPNAEPQAEFRRLQRRGWNGLLGWLSDQRGYNDVHDDWLSGLAGLDASGNIVQHAATRNSGMPTEVGKSADLVTLAPDARAEFGITNTDSVPNPDCPTEFPIAQTQVYPPNQTTPIRVPADPGAGSVTSPSDSCSQMHRCLQPRTRQRPPHVLGRRALLFQLKTRSGGEWLCSSLYSGRFRSDRRRPVDNSNVRNNSPIQFRHATRADR